MVLKEIAHIEDCFDGSYIKNFIFDDKITEKMIYHLGGNKELRYYKDFPKPFYQIIDKKYMIKGSVGNNYFQIIFYDKDKKYESEFTDLINLLCKEGLF